jgi:hypothetical protein
VYRHGRPVVGFVSGLLFGLGATVLLWQYDVWLLDIVTAIVVPLVLAIAFAVYAYIGKPYRLVAVGRPEPPPPAPIAGDEQVEPDDPPPPPAAADDDEPPPPPAV